MKLKLMVKLIQVIKKINHKNYIYIYIIYLFIYLFILIRKLKKNNK